MLDPWLAAAVAIAGAILGDAVSYELGRIHRGRIRGMWPLAKHPRLVEHGEAYFAKGGARAVMLGRFLGPVRAIVPLVAGMSGMPPWHFYAVNVLSAIAWAAAHLVPGILFGASLEVAGAISSRLVALLALVMVGLWLVTRVVKLLLHWGWPYVAHLREWLWRYAQDRRRPLSHVLARLLDPAQHEAGALLVSAMLLVGGAWLFLGVVEDVVTRDTLVDVDRAVYEALSNLRSRIGDDVMVTISELAGVQVTIALVAAIAVYLAVTRRFRTLAHWLAAAGFAQVLVFALKHAFARARPETAYAAIDEFSFPSGHAAMSLVVYGFLAFLLGHGKPISRQAWFALVAAAIATLVAFSRIYLGAHWLSDVIASFGLGIAWIALLAIGYIQHVREPLVRATPVLVIVVAVLAGFGAPYVVQHHARDRSHYTKLDVRPVLTPDAWRNGGWRDLPDARIEIRGTREEAFAVQWVATRAEAAQALTSAGWQEPAAWKSSASLLWLVLSTPPARLPVLPKLHEGQLPTLTFIRPIDAHARYVIRLWHAADAREDASTGVAVPIYAGAVTVERALPEARFMLVTRTEPREPAPNEALAEVVRRMPRSTLERRADGSGVLLVW